MYYHEQERYPYGNNEDNVFNGKKFEDEKLSEDEELNKIRDLINNQRYVFNEDLMGLSTDSIMYQLSSMGIPFDETIFLQDIKYYYSSQRIAIKWMDENEAVLSQQEQDFILVAASVLWERLAPLYILSSEKLENILDEYGESIEKNNHVKASDALFIFWEGLKYRYDSVDVTMDTIQNEYGDIFNIIELCQELEMVSYKAGLKDKVYFEKRITFCRELCNYFPNENNTLIYSMKQAIAESYALLGDEENANKEFTKIIEGDPNNLLGYISWGDTLAYQHYYYKAYDMFKKGLEIAKNKSDMYILEERMNDLKKHM